MTRLEREELNRLSKLCFGSSSKWKKLMDKGFPEPFEREREVVVGDGKGGLKKKVFKDHKGVIKHYSLEEVRKLMYDILNSRGLVKRPAPPHMTDVGTFMKDNSALMNTLAALEATESKEPLTIETTDFTVKE